MSELGKSSCLVAIIVGYFILVNPNIFMRNLSMHSLETTIMNGQCLLTSGMNSGHMLNCGMFIEKSEPNLKRKAYLYTTQLLVRFWISFPEGISMKSLTSPRINDQEDTFYPAIQEHGRLYGLKHYQCCHTLPPLASTDQIPFTQ